MGDCHTTQCEDVLVPYLKMLMSCVHGPNNKVDGANVDTPNFAKSSIRWI